MAEGTTPSEVEPDDVVLDVLPPEIEANLRRARHLHRRGMRARIRSNERTKALAESQEHIAIAMSEAAGQGVPLQQLPEWARCRMPPTSWCGYTVNPLPGQAGSYEGLRPRFLSRPMTSADFGC